MNRRDRSICVGKTCLDPFAATCQTELKSFNNNKVYSEFSCGAECLALCQRNILVRFWKYGC